MNIDMKNHCSLYSSSVGLAVVLAFVFIAACTSPKNTIGKQYRSLENAEQQMADTILLNALQQEALYTLLDTLKPMSSVKMYKLPLLSSQSSQRDSALRVLQQVQKVANALSNKEVVFVLNPFARGDSIYKLFELYVVRVKQASKKIAQYEAFYSSLGIQPSTAVETLLAVTEFEQRYSRWRSYGYLFGYPAHAVDFFVEAGKTQDSAKKFVTRNFFQIPVYVGSSGHFTYAIPKDYNPNATDSAIYHKAVQTLDMFKKIRPKYTTPSGVKAVQLWRKNVSF